jgi:ligand-binding sensor domain-containing protein
MRFKFILILLFSSVLTAQNHSDWQTITNMNEVRDLAADNEHVWVATSGGMYSYRLADGHISQFTNLEGLTHIALQAIAVDDHQHIIVGGKKGVLEIYQRESDSWYQLYSIEGSSISHIHYQNDTLWVAAVKGLAVFIFDGTVYKFKDYFKNFPVLPNSVTRTARFCRKGLVGYGCRIAQCSRGSEPLYHQ